MVLLGASQQAIVAGVRVSWQRLLDAIPGAQGFSAVLTPFCLYAAFHLVNGVAIWLDVGPSTMVWTGVAQWAKLGAMRKVARIDYLAWQGLGTGSPVQMIENGSDAAAQVVCGFRLGLARSRP